MASEPELVTIVDSPRDGRALADPTTLPRGTTIGRYVLIDKIGQGGMGVVYAAYDQVLHRRVAVKLVTLRGDPDGQRQLLAEARAMAQLSHPAIVAIHDVGELDGQLFLAMAFIDGMTLRRWQFADGRTWREIVALYRRIGEGLAFAHDARIVHRDFKPDNVLVDEDDRPYIADFGIAKIVSSLPPGDGSSAVTTAGGTPGYMSPQQVRGEPTDARTDQYAFCVSLFEALHQAMPLAQPRPPQDVPRRVLDAIERGLADDPDARWPSMHELLAELAPPAPRRPALLAMGAAVAVPAAIAGWLALRGAPEAASCEATTANARWTPVAHETLAAAFAREGMRADDVATALDDWTAAWTQMAEASCRATASGEQSAELLDLRGRCLLQALDVTSALVERISHGDRAVLVQAANVPDRLPSLKPCEDASALRGEPPLPADPIQRARIAALNTQLATAQAELDLDEFRAASDQLDAVAQGMRGITYAPLAFELYATRTQAEVNRDADPAAAADAAYRALAADPKRNDRAAATVWIHVVWIVSEMQHAPAQAIGIGQYAESLLAPDDKQLHAMLDHNLANALVAVGRFDDAIAKYQRSRAASLELHHDRAAIAAVQGEAVAVGARGDKAKQLELYEECVRMAERMPNAHVLHANVLNALGIAYTDAGRYADALAVLRRAKDAIGDGRDAPALLAAIHGNLGNALVHDHKLADAEVEYRAQLDIARTQLGADSSDVEVAWVNVGTIQADQHRYRDALVSLRMALAMLERAPRGALATGGLGHIADHIVDSEIALGRPTAALATADSILALAEQANLGPAIVADLHFSIAEAAWAAGDRARARSAMRLAIAEYHQAGLDSAEADNWLKAH